MAADAPNATLKGPQKWVDNIGSVLFSQEAIASKVAEMGAKISADFDGKEIIVVGLLKGAYIFLADLCRELKVEHKLDFIMASSYAGAETSGSVRLHKDLDVDPKGKHLLIVEDLIDTGTTLAWLKAHLQSKECASVSIACLLDKKARRTANIDVDYAGFDCPDEFVVGYGMDFNSNYRGLGFVGVLKPEAYA